MRNVFDYLSVYIRYIENDRPVVCFQVWLNDANVDAASRVNVMDDVGFLSHEQGQIACGFLSAVMSVDCSLSCLFYEW